MDVKRGRVADASTGAERRPSRAPSGAGGGPAEMNHALETMRVVSTILVLLYHAALTYLATPMRLTLWIAYDPRGHIGFDTFAYWVNGFVMPVFFFAAGVSAPAACDSRGPRVFVEQRARRLLRPLLFGMVFLLLPCYTLWGIGWMLTGRIDLENIVAWRYPPEISAQLYGLAHFWFLEYLFLVCLIWCAGWMVHRSWLPGWFSATDENGWIPWALRSPMRPVLLAIPTGLIFCVDPDTMLRVDNNIVPNLFRVLHYTYFFMVGGWISRIRDPKVRLIPLSTLYLTLSFALFALMTPLLLGHAAAPLQGRPLFLFLGMAALFPWLTIFGSLGVFLERVKSRGAGMRYLAEASFWVYLFHVPVVGACQIALLPLAWPAVVKFAITAVVALASSLFTYEYVVRRSLVGEVVNGSRKRSKKAGWLHTELGWILCLFVMASVLVGGAWYGRVFFWGNNLYEVIPGRLYRSARLSPADLRELIESKRVRTVVTLTGGSKVHSWYAALDQVCKDHQVKQYPVFVFTDRSPSRDSLASIVALLDQVPAPVLVQGYRGIDANAFFAALALLLDNQSPEVALRQFSMAYGQFGGPEHSMLGRTVLTYRDWLAASHLGHTPERFRRWVSDEYLVHSFPSAPSEHGSRLIADAPGSPTLAR